MSATFMSLNSMRQTPWLRWLGLIMLFGGLIAVMSINSGGRASNLWFGALATGLCFSLVAIGVYISFRILDFPDLTIDGSLPLGAAIGSTLIVSGVNPYLTLPLAFAGGAIAGVVTAIIATRLNIHSLLASILTTTALISVNLRIMGRSNIPLLNEATIFSPFADAFRQMLQALGGESLSRVSNNVLAIILVGIIVVLVKLFFDWFIHTEIGLAMRATGDNPQMLRALGTNPTGMIILGLAISNGLVGLSGAIVAQYQGFADVNMGLGLIIAGLAAVILGETFLRPRSVASATLAVVVGMVIYRVAIAAALSVRIPIWGGEYFRIDAQDVKLATALLVLLALWMSHLRKKNV